jgi:hypothetical protein
MGWDVPGLPLEKVGEISSLLLFVSSWVVIAPNCAAVGNWHEIH